MCGIVGVIGTNLTVTDEKIFKQLLQIDTLRGAHSTGIYCVDNRNEFLFKKAVDGYTFTDLKKYDSIMQSLTSPKLLLGHNRYATTGAVNNNNAHPFECGNTVMVHNGSLDTGWKGYLHNANKTVVDSEAVCFNIEEEGFEATMEKLKGAFMIVSYDRESDTVKFCRNTERPMHYAISKRGVIYFASEAYMLHLILNRNHVQFDKVYSLRDNIVWTVNLDTAKKVEDSEVSKIKLKKKIVQNYNHNQDWLSGRNYKDNRAPRTIKKTQMEVLGLSRGQEVIFEIETVTNNYGNTNLGGTIYDPKDGTIITSHGLIYSASKEVSKYDFVRAFVSHGNNRLDIICNTPKIMNNVELNKFYDKIADDGVEPPKEEKKGEIIDLSTVKASDNERTFHDNKDGMCSQKEFKELVKCGCVVCSSPISHEEPKDSEGVVWLDTDQPVCEDCVELYGGNAKDPDELKDNIKLNSMVFGE